MTKQTLTPAEQLEHDFGAQVDALSPLEIHALLDDAFHRRMASQAGGEASRNHFLRPILLGKLARRNRPPPPRQRPLLDDSDLDNHETDRDWR